MARKILIRSKRDPLYGFTPEGLIDFLKEALTGRAEQAYLYGSFGTEAFSRHSDIDLMIVCETDITFIERPSLFFDLRDRVPSLEILVYTPEEYESLTTDPSPGFWRSVVASSRQIL